MARYTDESRERVRDAVDFAEVVGARTELRRSGVNRLEGLCPFHDERSPSFGIDPTEKVYYCFGCQAGGDVFKFVMETENLGFGEALESLAERYRVPLERESEDPRDAEKRQRRERLLGLLERTAAFYVRVLWESPEAADARAYLASRGLDEGALRAYRVGFAPEAWDRVVVGSRRAGYSEAELLAAGLGQRSSRGTLIDRFHGRITFPLADERGRVLGFGARAMKPDQKPKYLNTSEGELFHKGRIVYGADLARAAAAKAGRVVLVEGYTDVIALHQAGVPEVVAQMGTALTDAQVDAIARLAPKALFCQDPDRAGQESVAKGIAALRVHNKGRTTRAVEFRIVRLPAGQDPADVVQQSGGDALRALLEKAVAIEKFEVERALASPDASTDEMLATVAPIIAPMSASILKDELVALVAGRLGMGENLVNEALRQPFTAASRGDMRGGGMPGRGGNPSRAGWSRPAPPSQGPPRYQQGPEQQGQAPPGGRAPSDRRGSPAGPATAGGQASSHGQAAGRGQAHGQAPPHGQSAPHTHTSPAPRQAGSHGEASASREAPSRPAAAASSPADDFEGPPPPEWDGFSGDGEDVDPGAMGPPKDWSEPTAANPGAQSAPPPAHEAPPRAYEPPPAYQPAPPQEQGWTREWQPRGGGGGRRGGGRGGGNYRGGGGRGDRDRYRRNDAPPPDPIDPRAVLAKREEGERTFLAFCLALPEQGEKRLAAVDVDDYFAAPVTRRAAAYLRGRLRSPMGGIPSGDDALAHTIAALVVQSGRLDATPAKLELEDLQMQLNRLDRHISRARSAGATGVRELAAERQRVLDEIRHKLT
ncbi:DNA primase [Solirubrobacter sp. CPCC 204708]|uniref:DNA primase n=1 Tax=Solirubrobacter deserti TaxID=2282478 RepID=A0ABT4RPV4_9ACTN|nr:DNA primase [Solirubrobacter deserti]MBE2316653.1 DNA primase [Solirubrobacter deserti]MDA0140551.1 DNA primase [Solirubrobacter deserti]